jgi:purine-binding chemotaxis protein CheW
MNTLAQPHPTAVQASHTPPAHQPSGASQCLIFSLGGELFALSTLRVREIIEYGNLTAVPMMPRFILGVINLRGAVVPVIDLNARFGRPHTKVSRRTCIVVLEVPHDEGTQVLSIIVDAVSAVRNIDSASVEASPSFGTHIRPDFIEGMAKVNGSFVILLDLGKVLSMDDISISGGTKVRTPEVGPQMADA